MKGKLALCSGDLPGIVTSDERKPSSFHEGETYVPGVNLLTGEPWGSRDPVILGTFAELLASGLPVKDWIDERRKSGLRE
jgi:hypothetical protein